MFGILLTYLYLCSSKKYNMDKNTIIGFALIAAVLFGFTWFNQPSAEDIEAQRKSDSLAVVNQQKKEQAEIAEIQRQAAVAKAMAEDSTSLFHNNMKGTEQRVTLENDKLALTFNTRGAVVEKVVIKNFEDLNGAKDLTLFDRTTQSLNFILTTKEQNISTKDLYFDVKQGKDGKQLVFIAGDEAGKNISVTYSLDKDYMLSCSILANGMSGLFAPNTTSLDIDWQERCKQQEKGFSFENRYATLTYHFTEGGTDYLNETSEKVDETVDEAIDWVAFKNQYRLPEALSGKAEDSLRPNRCKAYTAGVLLWP